MINEVAEEAAHICRNETNKMNLESIAQGKANESSIGAFRGGGIRNGSGNSDG